MPGDVIGSGTAGTGCLLELRHLASASGPPWLRPGNRVEVTVERIGTLAATIVDGVEEIPLR